jgi:hypothetical protein
MSLDGIIHATKHFAELDDGDVEIFLRDRRFRSEHLNLEFKRSFPLKGKGPKYDIKEICKYIVGLSNEEGGLVVYGVSDAIRDANSHFPSYVAGLTDHPSAEDLSQWAKETIYPLIESPAVRFFEVHGRKVAIFKIPPGLNKPYCYCDPSTKSFSLFKKTAGGIAELGPEDVREFFRTQIIEQANKILRAAELQEGIRHSTLTINEDRLKAHQRVIREKLENCTDFGFLGVYTQPKQRIGIPIQHLVDFLAAHRNDFSEALRYYRTDEPLQDGISVGYFPRAIRNDIKSTWRLTLYKDGLVALDSQADNLMDKNKVLHPYWLSYELQRHLQLSRTLLEDFGVDVVHAVVEFDNIEDFSLSFETNPLLGHSSYSGSHHPIERVVRLSEVHPYNSSERNIAMPVVKDIMDEVCRIFGFSKTPPGVWNQVGRLTYVPPGLEGQR